MERLPPEVLSYILSHCPTDEKAHRHTLKALSLTSSLFLPYCRSVRFKHIKLTDRKARRGLSPGSGLLELARTAPQILDCVREVTIHQSQENWLSDDLGLAEVVERLLPIANLTALTIRTHDWSAADWERFDPRVKNALVKLCRGISVRSVRLECTPIMLLALLSPSVRHLDVEYPQPEHVEGLGNDGDGRARARPKDVAVESLRESGSEYIQSLLNDRYSLRFDALKILEVELYQEFPHWDQLNRIFALCSASLEKLVLKPIGDRNLENKGEPFDFTQFRSLETLEIHIDATHFYNTWRMRVFTPFAIAQSFLTGIQQAPTVTEVHFIVKEHFLYGSPLKYLREDLAGLVAHAQDKDRFPNVKRMLMEVQARGYRKLDGEDQQSLEVTVREACFPGPESEVHEQIAVKVDLL